MKPKLYLETTVPSLYTAWPSRNMLTAAHQQITHEWWRGRMSEYEIHISDAVLEEASKGDPDAAARRLAAIASFEILPVTEDCRGLAQDYLRILRLPESAYLDAVHLAVASIYGLDYLVTWNCRHLANGFVMRRLPSINRALGLNVPTICTPEGLLYED